MTNNSNFFDRLIHYAALKGIKNANALAEKMGYKSAEKLYRLQRSSSAKPSYEIIVDVSNLFEELNLDWLLKGKGEMEFKIDAPMIVEEEAGEYSQVSVTSLISKIRNEESATNRSALLDQLHILISKMDDDNKSKLEEVTGDLMTLIKQIKKF